MKLYILNIKVSLFFILKRRERMISRSGCIDVSTVSLLLLLLLSHFSRVRLCDPIDSSPAGSPVPGIVQARTLEWVAISFSNAWKWKVKVKSLSRVRLLVTLWTAAHQAPPSMGFSRQEYWSGVPLPSLLVFHIKIWKQSVRPGGPYGLCHNTAPSYSNVKTSDNMQTNGHSCVPIKLH